MNQLNKKYTFFIGIKLLLLFRLLLGLEFVCLLIDSLENRLCNFRLPSLRYNQREVFVLHLVGFGKLKYM